MGAALDALLELLDLEQIELNIFRGRSPDEQRQRVFGGQVAGQALVAAGRTVPPDRPVHSLHAYFIRPGDTTIPLVYSVDRTRDGRSFTTRRVSAIQHGRTIFTLSASFHRAEPGPSHSDACPEVPPRRGSHGRSTGSSGCSGRCPHRTGTARLTSATSALSRSRRNVIRRPGSLGPRNCPGSQANFAPAPRPARAQIRLRPRPGPGRTVVRSAD